MQDTSIINIKSIKSKRVYIISAFMFVLLLLFTFFSVSYYNEKRDAIIDSQIHYLEGIVQTISSQINIENHKKLLKKYREKDDIFNNKQDSIYTIIHSKLKRAIDANGIDAVMFTFVLEERIFDQNAVTMAYYVVTSEENPYFRHTFVPHQNMAKNYDNGGFIKPGERDAKGRISVFVPLKDKRNNTIAGLQIDLPAKQYIAEAKNALKRKMLIIAAIIIPLLTVVFLVIRKISQKVIDEQDRLRRKHIETNQIFQKVINFLRQISKGNLNADIELSEENAVLHEALITLKQSLIDAENDRKKREIEDQRQRWATHGIGEMNEIMHRNNDALDKLGYKIIFRMVEYLEVNQGGLFIKNEEKSGKVCFDLTAAYAYDRKKILEKRVRYNEGMIGMCAAEKKTVYMVNLPENYISITSGLGNAIPDCLLIVPLKMADDVLGVIELAGFDRIEKYKIEFVEKVAENLASTISGMKINLKTQELLKQAQQQELEKKEQEEVMKQKIDELIKQRNEYERREQKLKNELEECKKEKTEKQNNA